MAVHPTRRALLGSVALAGTAALLPVAALATTAPTVSADLLALIAEADRRDAAADRFEREVFAPTSERWKAAEQAIPHVTFDADYLNHAGERPVLSTAKAHQVATAASMVAKPLDWFDTEEGEDYYRSKRRLLAASKWRERAVDRARRASGINEAFTESMRHSDLVYEADMAVVRYPAATLPDLLAVLGFMERRGLADDQTCIDALSAGIRRLAGEA